MTKNLIKCLEPVLFQNFHPSEFSLSFLEQDCSVYYIDSNRNIHFCESIETSKGTSRIIVSACFIQNDTIILLSTRKSFQKRGFAKELLQHVVLNFNILILHTRISNTKAIDLYLKCGFQIDSLQENFYYYTPIKENAYRMIYKREFINESKNIEENKVLNISELEELSDERR